MIEVESFNYLFSEKEWEMDRNKFPVVILRVIAVIFLGLAIIVWVYGSGTHRGLDALFVGIAAITFFILSFFISRNIKKRM